MTLVKICGITNYEDARAALDLGADALGFNFYPKSKRYIDPGEAKSILSQLPIDQWYVGVFVNALRSEIKDIIQEAGINTLQFHGDEPVEFCKGWKGLRVIKALCLGERIDFGEVKSCQDASDYLLFDHYDPSEYGGTGKEIESDCLENLKAKGVLEKAFLAGGLTPENVAERVCAFKPFGVDVASGVESSPGKKDCDAIRKFVEAVRAV